MSAIIAFQWTTPALLAGAKTCTRRQWAARHAQSRSFHEFQIVKAYDRSPRVGGRHVADIRIGGCYAANISIKRTGSQMSLPPDRRFTVRVTADVPVDPKPVIGALKNAACLCRWKCHGLADERKITPEQIEGRLSERYGYQYG